MRRFLFLVVLVVVTTPLCARAYDCTAGPVSGISGTNCTIGNMTFSFQATTGYGVDAAQLQFTPLVLNPDAVGFRLYSESSLWGDILLSLPYTVAVTDPSSGTLITGTTVTVLDATLWLSSPQGSASATVSNQLNNNAGCTIGATSGVISTVWGQPPYGSGPESASFAPACILNSNSGEAVLMATKYDDGAMAYFHGGDVIVNETTPAVPTPAVPEPASLILVGSGIVLLINRTKRS